MLIGRPKRELWDWHRWFAWHPVRDIATTRLIWLEMVERKMWAEGRGRYFEYKRESLKWRLQRQKE